MLILKSARSTLGTIAVLGLLAAVFPSSSAFAGVIDYQPSLNGNAQNIAANEPQYGNVWTGVSQSFTAEDSQVSFGFYTFSNRGIPTAVLFSLYAGDNTFNSLLSQRSTTWVSGTYSNPTLLAVDFSDTLLSVGIRYTVSLSLPGRILPTLGTKSDVSIRFANQPFSGQNTNPYSGGSFFYTGATYTPSSFSNWDAAFKVTPITSGPSVPDTSTTSSLVFFSLAGLAALRRKLKS